MTHPRFALLPVGTALVVMLCAHAPSAAPQSRGTTAGAKRPANPPGTRRAYQGAGSCAAAHCHGASESKPGDASAYRVWLTRDPHARAYAVLENETSSRIALNLARDPRKVTPPVRDARCLNCHAPAQAQAHAPASALAEGVTCESCHGPAEGWLEAHWSDWNARPVGTEERRSRGMTLTGDVFARTTLCAGCHVGERDRDVNHDLIAAGHPRLNFEYSAFMANLPRHWNLHERKDGTTDSPSAAWAVGQMTSALAALELLGSRTGETVTSIEHDAPTPPPWPEFAEYSCVSCHHDLAVPAWSGGWNDRAGKLGALPWGTWYFAIAPLLDGAGTDAHDSPLALLARELGRPEPRPDQARRLAGAAAVRYRQWLAEPQNGNRFSAKEHWRLIDGLTRPGARRRAQDWDGSVQIYLAASALNETLAQRGERPSDSELRALRGMFDALQPPADYDSPRGSPKRAPDAFQTSLRDYLDATREKVGP